MALFWSLAANPESFSTLCILTFSYCHAFMKLSLNVKTTDCAALSPFSCWETIFQPVLSQSISEMLEDSRPMSLRIWGNCVACHIVLLCFKVLPHISSSRAEPLCLGRCQRSARRLGSAVTSWLHSVVTHNGARSHPQRASTSRAVPLFKNVFVLLFFLGTM